MNTVKFTHHIEQYVENSKAKYVLNIKVEPDNFDDIDYFNKKIWNCFVFKVNDLANSLEDEFIDVYTDVFELTKLEINVRNHTGDFYRTDSFSKTFENLDDLIVVLEYIKTKVYTLLKNINVIDEYVDEETHSIIIPSYQEDYVKELIIKLNKIKQELFNIDLTLNTYKNDIIPIYEETLNNLKIQDEQINNLYKIYDEFIISRDEILVNSENLNNIKTNLFNVINNQTNIQNTLITSQSKLEISSDKLNKAINILNNIDANNFPTGIDKTETIKELSSSLIEHQSALFNINTVKTININNNLDMFNVSLIHNLVDKLELNFSALEVVKNNLDNYLNLHIQRKNKIEIILEQIKIQLQELEDKKLQLINEKTYIESELLRLVPEIDLNNPESIWKVVFNVSITSND